MSYIVGDKVELHKVAFDWMELSSKGNKSLFEFELWKMLRMDVEESELNSLIDSYEINIIDLVNAYQFGYKLEETKEEKEFKKVRKHLFDMGIQLPDEEIEALIKLIKGDNICLTTE